MSGVTYFNKKKNEDLDLSEEKYFSHTPIRTVGALMLAGGRWMDFVWNVNGIWCVFCFRKVNARKPDTLLKPYKYKWINMVLNHEQIYSSKIRCIAQELGNIDELDKALQHKLPKLIKIN